MTQVVQTRALVKCEHQLWAMEKHVKNSVEAYRLAKAVAKYPARYFVPNGAQEQTIQAMVDASHESKTPILLYTFANGVGKSKISAHFVANIIYGPQNGWFDYEIFRRWPYPRVIWYVSNAPALKDTVIPEILRLLKPGTFTTRKGHSDHITEINILWGGKKWQLMFKTYDQDPKVFESTSVGCLDENERVLMADGTWKAIGDILVGDEVIAYGAKDAWRRSLNKGERMPRGQQVNTVSAKIVHQDREMLEICGSGGFSIRCTPDHRFWVYAHGWMEAQDIKEGMKLSRQDISIDGTWQCEPWQAAILGALIGDGSVTGKHVHFTCYNDTLLEGVRALLPVGYEIHLVGSISRPDRKEYRIVTKAYHFNQLKLWLKEVGIWGHYAKDKFIPEIIFKETIDKKVLFLEYLYATDGWFSGRSIGYASTSKRLVADLKLLLQSIGINSSLYFKERQRPQWNDQWHLQINKSTEIVRFCDQITVKPKADAQQSVLRESMKGQMQRKRQGQAIMGGDVLATETPGQRKRRKMLIVKSVEPVGKGTVVDIQTDPNHNFVTNGVLTHNCIVLDEPAPKEIFDACKSRRRLGCVMLLPQTPLYTPPYVVDNIMAAADEGKKGYRHLTADLYAASRTDGVRGHLDPEVIETMVADYDPEEIEARVFGRQMYYSGAIYPGLYREKHLVDPEEYPVEPHSVIMQVVDPHDSRESAVIWIALGPSGRYIVIAEAPIRIDRPYWDMSRSEEQGLKAEVRGWIRIENSLKEKFRNIEGVVDDMGKMKVLRIMDRHFGWQTRGQRTLAGMYGAEAKLQGRKDFNFIKSYSASGGDVGEVQYGHMMVRKVYSNVLADERPGFVIWDVCYHTWNGLTHYIKRRRTGKLSDDHAKTDGIIVPRFTDFADASRYGVCAPMILPTTPEELTIHQERFAAVRDGRPFDGLTDGKKPWLR